MGPQLYSCGNTACANPLGSHTTRFNGAAILSLRKLMSHYSHTDKAMELQWGRNFIVAEIRPHAKLYRVQYMLQWGRNFIVAEITTLIVSRNRW